MDKIDQARKAVAALLVPALVVIIAALLDGSDGGSRVTTSEWLTALVASLTASGTVYAVRNGADSDPTTSTPDVGGRHLRGDAGMSTAGVAALTALAVVLVVLFLLPQLRA